MPRARNALRGSLFLVAFAATSPAWGRASSTLGAGQPPEPAGGGAISRAAGEGEGCLTPEQRAWIERRIESSVRALLASGRLGAEDAAARVLFASPIGAAGLTASDFDVHGISNFVDHNSPVAPVLDFECGTRTYAIPGYSHSGTDFFSWPFAWYRMDHDQVIAVAAAPGTIVLRDDGNYDRSCPGASPSTPWNAVYVRHADGSVAWYGHLKNGSLTSKQLGDSVALGEFLGVVGSSGYSTGPHVHFEVHEPDKTLIDPWEGPCNPGVSSWWVSQRPYYDPAINKLATHSAPPILPACPQPETPNLQDAFAAGDTVYFAAYYHDQRAGEVTRYSIRRPDGSDYATWMHASPAPYYAASYWYWSYTLPASEPQGRWIFAADYQGQHYEHPFTVGTSSGACASDARTLCLLGDRFQVEVSWQNQFNGSSGSGVAIPATDSTGFFYFTDPSNYELIVKALDIGGVIKLFYAELTDLIFTITVTDTRTQAVRTYRNTPGDCGAIDENAFAAVPPEPRAERGRLGTFAGGRGAAGGKRGTCVPASQTLCLLDGRFRVAVDWTNQFNGASGVGSSRSLSDQSGLFSFADPTDVELVLKAVEFPDRVAVFYGALSDFAYDITVTDTVGGGAKTYHNPAGHYCGGLDNDAFPP